jgi:hypothetical protein
MHQDAFAADYQEEEYRLIGMAIRVRWHLRQRSPRPRTESGDCGSKQDYPVKPSHADDRRSVWDDLFGTPQGSPRTDKLIEASIQWAEQIMRKIDNVFGSGK